MMSEIECAFTGTSVEAPTSSKSGSVVIGGEAKQFMRVTCFGDIAERVAA